MKIQVFDIGNSHLKNELWQIDMQKTATEKKLLHHHHTPTSPDMADNLQIIEDGFKSKKPDGVIFITMSDNVVWQSPEGYIRWIPAQEPTHPYARREQVPAYRETGKTQKDVLTGIFNHLLLIRTQVGRQGFGKVRILPFSGMCAAHLAGAKYFKNWDITHASNSGVFSYQLPSHDERFPNNGWHPCIDEFIDKGWIEKRILPCDHILKAKDGTPILIGGHDTTFASALDMPYSTKPYVSVGTWTTVSVESSVRPNWVDEGARYIVAPNGTLLKQLCFPSPTNDVGKSKAVYRISEFLQKHLPKKSDVKIPIFGSWQREMHTLLAPLIPNVTTTHPHYLTQKAAIYAAMRIAIKQ